MATVWELPEAPREPQEVEVRGQVFRLDPEPNMAQFHDIQGVIHLNSEREKFEGAWSPELKAKVPAIAKDILELTERIMRRTFGEHYDIWLAGEDGRPPIMPDQVTSLLGQLIQFYYPGDPDAEEDDTGQGGVDPKATENGA